MFRSKRNRRRIDAAKKTGELKAAAQRHLPVVLKLGALVVGSLLVTVGGVEGWKWACTTRQFALQQVRVSGHSQATDVELVRLGGVSLGQNLIAMDVRSVERAIGTHPWVKSVRVARHLPSSLAIEVVEQRAIATVSLGELYLVNPDGELFKRIKPGDDVDLPVIMGLDRDAFAERSDEALASLRQALELIEAYGSHPKASKQPLSSLSLHPDGMAAVTADGQEVEFGEGTVELKLDRLARVREELKTRSMVAEVIRLDNRARPSWVAVQVAAKRP